MSCLLTWLVCFSVKVLFLLYKSLNLCRSIGLRSNMGSQHDAIQEMEEEFAMITIEDEELGGIT